MSKAISTQAEQNIKPVPQTDASTRSPEKTPGQWQLATPVYLLLILFGLTVWTLGFVDILNPASISNPTIFGLYSPSYFVFVVAYALGFAVWLALLARPSHSGWLTKTVTTIQRTPWLAALSLGLITFLIWILITVQPQVERPLTKLLAELRVVRFITFLSLLLMAGALIIFGGWTKVKPVQIWRKLLAFSLAAVLLVELVLQVLVAANLLPGTQKIADLFVPYGRVYYEGEGFAKGRLNNYGWYYPDFDTNDKSRRIMLVGDTFIQALQINPEQHLGVLLDEKISHNLEESQVMALGFPGFGPGLYLDVAVLAYPVRSLKPDEMVVVVELGSDLDNTTVPADSNIYFELDERGNARVHPDSFKFWHNLAHYVIVGFQLLDPALVLRANYLTPKLFSSLTSQAPPPPLSASSDGAGEMAIPGFKAVVTDWGLSRGTHTVVNATTLIDTPGASNYLFESQPGPKADEALAITKSLISLAYDYALAKDMSFRLVTVPAFPEAFYQKYNGGMWQPEIGDYDLFRPDRELQAFAEKKGIPFLSVGQLMYDQGLPSDEIMTFYYSDGTGHLTPAGHQFLAEAIYTCFYANQKTTIDGQRGQGVDTTACVN